MNDKEKVEAFLEKHFTRKGFGNHFNNEKAAQIASALCWNGSYLTQFDGENGQHAIYDNGKLFQLFTREKEN